mmetsp:Transcript_22854/g.29287  ORF Transcript_22854/g.29287 Transcript_22854/m.29287 type:complete len:323 (+) Transcript_22854:67-1035(+)
MKWGISALALVLVTGCSTTLLNPPAAKKTTTKIGGGAAKSIIQFSNTRSETHFSHERPDDDSDYVTGNFLSCFSPMPDTATQIAAALKGSANYGAEQALASSLSRERSATVDDASLSSSRAGEQSANNSLTAGASFEGSLSTTIVQLDGRTELVVAARDIFNSICMFYVNGMLTQDEVSKKFDDTLKVITALADSEEKEAEAKKTEAEAKKSEADAKKAAATADQIDAEAALITAQVELIKQSRTSNVRKFVGVFLDNAGDLDVAKWTDFLNDDDGDLIVLLGGYGLNDLRTTSLDPDAITAALMSPRYDDVILQLIELAGG